LKELHSAALKLTV